MALAEAQDGRLLRLDDQATRRNVVDELVGLARHDNPAIVGLDFGFSMPAWYLEKQGCGSAPELWKWLAHDGCAESLLSECARPFWGRDAAKRPDLPAHHRITELRAREPGLPQPKSVFQISGPGSVGTGSLRGMCELHVLREAGWAIWPFDDQSNDTIIEIYPRLLTLKVIKAAARTRRAYLAERTLQMTPDQLQTAIDSEDAFDAAISAIEMSKHAADLEALPHVQDPVLRLEGIIWWPRWHKAHVDLLS
jgi:hypothetical protein